MHKTSGGATDGYTRARAGGAGYAGSGVLA